MPPVLLDAGGVPLSGLLVEPAGPSRGVLVAVPGAGMRAGYFDSPVRPELSLLRLAGALGFTGLALDRPGYGASATGLPEGLPLAGQASLVRAALAGFAGRHPVGAGFFLVGHSFGGTLALELAARRPPELLGVDVSGVSHRYAVEPRVLEDVQGRSSWPLHWGRLSDYPPGAFQAARPLLAPVPARERSSAREWPQRFPGLAERIAVPVRFTFAERERWWRHDRATLESLAGALSSAPEVGLDRLRGAGHNISLGWAARPYHLRVLAFLEECLTAARPA